MENNTSGQKSGDTDFIKFVNRSKLFITVIFKNLIWIGIIASISAGISLYIALKQDDFYQCKLTFILDEEKSNNNFDVAALTGIYAFKNENQLGTSSDRIMKLFQSNSFLKEELLKKDSIKNTSLANRVLENYDKNLFFSPLSLIDSWNEGELEQINYLDQGFKFNATFYDSLNKVEKAILTNIIDHLTMKKEPICRIKFDEDSGFFTLVTQSINHDLSIDLTNSLFRSLSKYYTENKTLKYKDINEINTTKTDSLRKDLAAIQFKLANFKDSNLELIYSKSRLKEKQLRTELEVTRVLYAEARKQLQISEYTLRQIKPIFQVIDHPAESLKRIKPSKKRALFYGFILGAFLTMGCIVLMKVVALALVEEKS